jgi:hypothetical protein
MKTYVPAAQRVPLLRVRANELAGKPDSLLVQITDPG